MFGVGTTLPSNDDSAMPFIESVDRKLYEAKQQGRDRIAAIE